MYGVARDWTEIKESLPIVHASMSASKTGVMTFVALVWVDIAFDMVCNLT